MKNAVTNSSCTRRIARGLFPAPAVAGGEIVAGGDDTGGQCKVPATLNTDFVAIAAGGAYSLAAFRTTPAVSGDPRIYDVAGRLVRTLVNEERPQGRRTVAWEGGRA